MNIMNYSFQGTMMEFVIGGAIIGAAIQLFASISNGRFPLGELIMPAMAGGVIGIMIFFFYSGTR